MNARDDDASDSNGPDPQEWYTGGASSGQAVIDPRERPDERLASMFDSARAHGAMDGMAEDLNPNESRGARGGAATAFRGRGRTLNSNAEEEAEAEDEASGATAATEDEFSSLSITRRRPLGSNGATASPTSTPQSKSLDGFGISSSDKALEKLCQMIQTLAK